MSSEAITQNDLREILSRTVGSVPSEYKKLLWTNPSPTANFAPQTIALNLSEYDAIEVVANPFADLQYQYFVTCPVGAGGNLEYQILNTATATNASTFINGVSRTFRVSTSGITFDNGQMTYNDGAYTNWQNRAIPYKIYGIKYERVAPPQVDASDYVVERGTEGIWTYRKWDSGVSECWGTHSVTLTHYATSGGFYGFTTSVTFPQNLFSERPVAVYNCLIDSAFSMSATNLGLTKDDMNLYGLSNVGNTQATVWDIQVKGRWK